RLIRLPEIAAEHLPPHLTGILAELQVRERLWATWDGDHPQVAEAARREMEEFRPRNRLNMLHRACTWARPPNRRLWRAIPEPECRQKTRHWPRAFILRA